ncbi:MAG: bifunctional folylpolyglutamate synthase/dihydrofolate synthase [Pedobacter sp.]|nr:MAG: bifunctional folylpolyglutamate synthase/dihydrofolate synthase [Pedobacter sp.]
MTYSEVVQYLYSKLPMFTRIGSSAYKADLNNTIEFCRQLKNPQNRFKSVHVGGTNGKGSTSHMLAAILQTAGYKTGLYTSPHLRDFRERIRVNGKMITEEKVISFVETNQSVIETIQPSFFEATVAMAFEHFAQEEVDIAVIEVGLGGRLDSTNIIHPILSIITNISFDHTDILGNTLIQIASEKAGIIKPKIPVVIGETQSETSSIFIQKAQQNNSKITFADQQYHIYPSTEQAPGMFQVDYRHMQTSTTGALQSDLRGNYQLKNIATVLTAIDELQNQGLTIPTECLHAALRQVNSLTGLLGRWQVLNQHPLIICDTGHNVSGITEVLKNIRTTPHNQLHMVIGMVKDKDSSVILNLLPKNAHYYFCQPDLPRAKPVAELALQAKASGLDGKSFDTVSQALDAAKTLAKVGDLIFVGGSTFVVAEVV